MIGEFTMDLDFEQVRDEWKKFNEYKNGLNGG